MDIGEIEIPFKVIEIIYYATVWLVACFAGIARSLRSNSRFICRDFISVGMCSGFLGFAVVSIRDFATGGFGGTEWGGIGIAALIGLAGQEQEQIIKAMWRVILKKFGLPDDAFPTNKTEETNIRNTDSDRNNGDRPKPPNGNVSGSN